MMRIMPPYTLKWLHGEYEQNEISALIRENYHQVYRASISRCLPWLLGLYDANGELQAASGVQIASHGALYLENYLDNPIETLLTARLMQPVSRNTIVEIGNFAARDGASARIMFAALCQVLTHYHFSWIVFTGTKKIRNTFHRLNLHPLLLMPADPARLGSAASEWGKYYQYDPQIMAGELSGGHSALNHGSLLLRLLTDLPEAPWTHASGEKNVSERT
ncbi:thermostable hemolysin [Lelliottia amnigena]|nr:thermostable hemolysin [Lelliottia amnigena]